MTKFQAANLYTGKTTVVSDAGQLDQLLDEAQALSRELGAPILAYVLVSADGEPGGPGLTIGANNDLGLVGYSHPKAEGQRRQEEESLGDRDGEPVVYHWQQGNHWAEQHATAEIPYEQVRAAAHEFITSGGERPTIIKWQPYHNDLDGG